MRIIPVSVLIEICKAMDGDEEAKAQAAEVAIPLVPPVAKKLSAVAMYISDVEVRRWALNELKGVSDDHSNIGE